MMLARLQADMLDKKPSVVVVEAGRNDISAGDTAATLTTELFGMWEQILATGARVIATTITPRDADTGTTFFSLPSFIFTFFPPSLAKPGTSAGAGGGKLNV